PRTVSLASMNARETACLHVQAFDRVQNSTAEQVSCAAPLSPPAMPAWPGPSVSVAANPVRTGLVGLETWFWLAPAPGALTADETYQGVEYTLIAAPVAAIWDFGDGITSRPVGDAGFGRAYPLTSSVVHTYEAHSQAGYTVRAEMHYDVTWTASIGGRRFGPYPLGSIKLPVRPLVYAVEQAQPELIATG
ncbi:MAG: hypothetical protein ACYDAL_17295, partial [Candidatus Dormibacteraceae bacterium]